MSRSRFRVLEHDLPAQHIREYPGATAKSQEDTLRIHIKQYIPLQIREPIADPITIIGTHANGFPKELYEPLWDEIMERSIGKFSIRGIWIADVAHQGKSYVLNEQLLSNDPSWFDHSRDLLHMINHFRSEIIRPIVGIGHSFGGAQLVNLSLFHPRLFASLVLLDPVIEAGSSADAKPARTEKDTFGIATASTYRRDIWPSTKAAQVAFSKSSFYQRWDTRVLDAFVHFGLRELPTAVYPAKNQDNEQGPPVTLVTPKHQEVWTYLRPNFFGRDEKGHEIFNRERTPDIGPGMPYTYPFYRPESSTTFSKLPFLRPSTFFVLGEQSTLSEPELQRDKVKFTGIGTGGNGGLLEGRVKDTVLPGTGHLVPMEAPDATAQEIVNWLEIELRVWRHAEEKWYNSLRDMPQSDHLRVNKEWLRHIGTIPGRSKGTTSSKI